MSLTGHVAEDAATVEQAGKGFKGKKEKKEKNREKGGRS
ncbi:unannotated protein [freshwater metagenome]